MYRLAKKDKNFNTRVCTHLETDLMRGCFIANDSQLNEPIQKNIINHKTDSQLNGTSFTPLFTPKDDERAAFPRPYRERVRGKNNPSKTFEAERGGYNQSWHSHQEADPMFFSSCLLLLFSKEEVRGGVYGKH